MSKRRRGARGGGDDSRRGARAGGLERGRFADAGEPLVERLVLDVIARVRASPEPLDRALHAAARRARLGPRERRRAADLAFAHARARARAESLIAEAVRAHGGVAPPKRDQDRAALALAALGHALAPPAIARVPEPLLSLLEDARTLGFGALTADHPALPAWLVARLESAYGDDAPALTDALTSSAPVVLAFDPRATSRDEVRDALAALDVESEPSPHAETALRLARRVPLTQLPSALRDAVWPMDDGSQAVAHALGAGEGDVVLDLCAGGGGKSRLLTALGARVVACDVDAGRLAAAHTRAGAATVLADGRAPPFARGSARFVLVDAPCSGTGTLRRAPDLAARLAEEEIERYAETQRALLTSSLALLAPGGVLVYATCSLLPEENGAVVQAALDDGTSLLEERMLLPSVDGTDGFYLARLSRAD